MKFEGNHELPSLEFIEDEGLIKIWGRSISIEPTVFWTPLHEKMEEYLKESRDIIVSLDFEYFNTPSAKHILQFLYLLKDKVIIQNKRKLLIKWIYEDEDMRGTGEDYQSMVKEATWKFIENNN